MQGPVCRTTCHPRIDTRPTRPSHRRTLRTAWIRSDRECRRTLLPLAHRTRPPCARPPISPWGTMMSIWAWVGCRRWRGIWIVIGIRTTCRRRRRHDTTSRPCITTPIRGIQCTIGATADLTLEPCWRHPRMRIPIRTCQPATAFLHPTATHSPCTRRTSRHRHPPCRAHPDTRPITRRQTARIRWNIPRTSRIRCRA